MRIFFVLVLLWGLRWGRERRARIFLAHHVDDVLHRLRYVGSDDEIVVLETEQRVGRQFRLKQQLWF